VKSCQKHCFIKTLFSQKTLFSPPKKTHCFPTCAFLYPIVLKQKIITDYRYHLHCKRKIIVQFYSFTCIYLIQNNMMSENEYVSKRMSALKIYIYTKTTTQVCRVISLLTWWLPTDIITLRSQFVKRVSYLGCWLQYSSRVFLTKTPLYCV